MAQVLLIQVCIGGVITGRWAIKRLVVVDDNRLFVDLVCDLLLAEGWETIGLHRGDAAFAAIKQAQPDLVILDVRMEEPDTGWQVLSLLVLDPATCHIPVLMSSSDWDQLYQRDAWLHAHGVGILPRPFDVADLTATLDRIMAGGVRHLDT